MRTKSILLLVLAFLAVLPAKAQLRAPFRSEDAGVRYVQLPTSDKKYRDLTVQTTQKATLGEKVAEKAERVTGALGSLGIAVEDNTGSFTDKQAPAREYQIIPNIFPAEGEIFLEVLFYDEDRTVTGKLPNRFYDGGDYEVKVEYNVYEMPDKKLIESHGPFWVAGKGSASAGPMQSREDKYKDRLRIAQGWATDQVMMKYSLKHAYLPVKVYTIRSLSGDDDNLQSEAQSKFVTLAGQFRTRQNEDEYKNEVKECIAMWEKLLKQYSPGVGRRDADINDGNVFALYYNLAAANYLIGNIKKGNDLAKKGMVVTNIGWEDVTNRSGEVIGRKRSGIVHVTEDIFHNLKESMEAYYAGKKAHNPAFVAMVTDGRNMARVSRAARNAAVNIYLSQAIGIDYPVDIITPRFDEMPKGISGTISKEGSQIATFQVKKNFLAFIQKPKTYKVSVVNNDETTKAKQNLNEIMLPPTNYDFVLTTGRSSFIGLPEKVSLGKLKTKPNKSKMMDVRFMYDYKANVIITNNMIQDKWWYMRNIALTYACENDALLTKRSETIARFDGYTDLSSIDMELTTIERERDFGFMPYVNAIFDKPWNSTGRTMKHKVLSSNTEDVKVNLKSQRKVEETDDNGNWTKMKIGDVVIERTMTY